MVSERSILRVCGLGCPLSFHYFVLSVLSYDYVLSSLTYGFPMCQ